MRLFNRFMFPLLAVADASSGVATVNDDTTGKGKEDIIEFLAEDDDKPETIDLGDKKPKTDKEDKSDKDDDKDGDKTHDDEVEDELKAIEEELEGPDEEKLELVTPVSRREILKAYPDLFKKFPYLEKAYYREQQYTELLPTIDDAKEAVASRETLNNFESDLTKGNTETILKAVKETNPKAFYKIADEYLETLAKVDEKAYHHVVGNTIKHLIIQMVREAKTSKNESLEAAATIVNQFAFMSSEFKQPTRLVTDADLAEDKKTSEVDTEREQINQERFDTAHGEINTRIENVLRSTIEANIDPKDSMGSYVKKNASRDALDTLTELISKDSRFKTLVDKLWIDAQSKNYNKDSMDRIRSAYTSKAKTLLPSVIKKARNEALKGIGKRVKDDDIEVDNNDTGSKGPIKTRREAASPETRSGKTIKDAKDIPRGMRSIDFLMQD